MASPTLTVSLTSVATRESLLMGAVTSMLRQTRRPDRIKVFLSDQPFLRDTAFPNRQLPDQLDRFFAHYHQIVELHWIPNHGPFRKFIPALQQSDSDEDLIVTIDDDTYYIPTLLERLEQEAINHDCITANWCKRMKPQQHLCRLDYYEGLLGEEHPRQRSLYNFHVGKGSVCYRRRFFRKHLESFLNPDLYLKICPSADDVWFNLFRMDAGVDCIDLDRRYMLADYFEGPSGLWNNINRFNRLDNQHILNVGLLLADLNAEAGNT